MSLFIQNLPGETGSTPNIEEERRLVFWQREKLQRPMRHLRLDALHTSAECQYGVFHPFKSDRGAHFAVYFCASVSP